MTFAQHLGRESLFPVSWLKGSVGTMGWGLPGSPTGCCDTGGHSTWRTSSAGLGLRKYQLRQHHFSWVHILGFPRAGGPTCGDTFQLANVFQASEITNEMGTGRPAHLPARPAREPEAVQQQPAVHVLQTSSTIIPHEGRSPPLSGCIWCRLSSPPCQRRL